MKIVIIEDELHQQEILKKTLKDNFPQIELTGIAGNVNDAIQLLSLKQPDLVFMDVQLKDQTCFDLLDKLPSRNFEIIFTTSYEEYAVKAFRLAAADYLLKPIDLDELKNALEKVSDHSANGTLDHVKLLLSNISDSNQQEHRIALPTLTGFTLVEIDNITRCESDNTYTTFYLKNRKQILVSKTLKSCEKILSDYTFFRVHNSTLINLKYVKEYIKGEGGVVIMDDAKEVNVSRRRKEDFLRKFSKVRL